MIYKFTLPFPPSILNPNVKKHWRAKQPFKVKYREDCFYASKSALEGRTAIFPGSGRLAMVLKFYPPHNRFDDDNIVSMFKSGRDGLAKALGVNDKRFKSAYSIEAADKHNPRIEGEIREI